jgi:hypothetical protein
MDSDDNALPRLSRGPWQHLWPPGPVVRVLACFAVCGLLFSGVLFAGATWYRQYLREKELDQLFRQVLAEGDVEDAYRRSHPQLQALYPREIFQDYARRRPSLFQRDRLKDVRVEWKRGDGG